MIDADLIISGGTVLTMDAKGTRIEGGAIAVKGRVREISQRIRKSLDMK